MNVADLLERFDVIAQAPGGVQKLCELVLTLAVQGRLVAQDPADEPASVLLERIKAEKAARLAQGKGKKEKPLPAIADGEKPFELPNGWKWVRWSEVALQIGDIDHRMPREVMEGVPYISPRDFFGSNQIDFDSAKKISSEDFALLSAKIKPEVGDLIYPRYGTIGNVRFVEQKLDFLASYSCAVIKSFDGFVEPRYQHIFSISSLAHGQADAATNKTTQPNVGLKSIQQFLFPLPPLAEQSRIVAKVEQLMALIDRLGAAQTRAATCSRALAEATLQSLSN